VASFEDDKNVGIELYSVCWPARKSLMGDSVDSIDGFDGKGRGARVRAQGSPT
jgi:hypothetical protein